jgi:H+/Cl- antiporter ClcA
MTILKKMDKNRKFALVSLAIFGVITVLSIIFFKTCTSDYCDFNAANTLNIVIITFGIIGLMYCFFLLKDFNTTIDKNILNDYKKVLEDSPEKEMKLKDIIEQDNDNKKQNGDKTLSLF